MEDSRDAVDEVGRNVRRLESSLLVEIGDCRRSGDGLEKRLSKLEGVCGRLDGVSDSIHKLNQGKSWQGVELSPLRVEVRFKQSDCGGVVTRRADSFHTDCSKRLSAHHVLLLLHPLRPDCVHVL